MDGKISDFLKMKKMIAAEKGWDKHINPENAPMSILYSIEELGEAIAIIKKKGANGIMNNESVRSHFVEEVADTFMYLFDMMNAYEITSEEFTNAFVTKFEKNLGRNWSENSVMYEKCDKKLIIFDMEGTITHENVALPWTARLTEVLARTDLKLVIVSDLDEGKVKKILSDNGIDSANFDKIIQSLHYSAAYDDAMKLFDATPETTILCSSSSVAIKLAQRAKITSVAVQSRLSAELYRKAGADYICRNLTELEKILGFVK